MKLFGIQVGKSITNRGGVGGLAMVDNRGSWWSVIKESFAGAWQKNVEVRHDTVLAHYAVFACISLIASDISKLCMDVVTLDKNGIWNKTPSPKYSDVITKPNGYQNRIQFFENWLISKLTRGNTYVLKQRDGQNNVIGLYVLDPLRVIPLIALDGQVFYQLMQDNLTDLPTEIIVPAREIIHDRFNCLFHPLVGLSPVFAAGLAAVQGVEIQHNSARFFKNNSNPGGILTAPGAISPESAALLKTQWEENYGGKNTGRVAVLADGLKFERMSDNSVDSQLVDQLRLTAEVVCSTFHVPMYKIGNYEMPRTLSIEALNIEYWTQCLQILISSIELCLDEGLGMQSNMTVQFDVDDLLRMDSMQQATVMKEQAAAGFLSPNEGRVKICLPPVTGGESPYLQQQNFSLAALAKRDATDNPFASNASAPGTAAQSAAYGGAGNAPANVDNTTSAKEMLEMVRKELASVHA